MIVITYEVVFDFSIPELLFYCLNQKGIKRTLVKAVLNYS